MGFKFSLAAVLRIRTSLEDREERVLGQIVHELTQVSVEIERTTTAIGDSVKQREAQLTSSEPAVQLQYAYHFMEELKQRRLELEERHRQLDYLRLQQIKVYEIAHRNRKMLTDLSNERRAIYEAREAKLEQSAIDDTFAAGLSRRLHGE